MRKCDFGFGVTVNGPFTELRAYWKVVISINVFIVTYAHYGYVKTCVTMVELKYADHGCVQTLWSFYFLGSLSSFTLFHLFQCFFEILVYKKFRHCKGYRFL